MCHSREQTKSCLLPSARGWYRTCSSGLSVECLTWGQTSWVVSGSPFSLYLLAALRAVLSPHILKSWRSLKRKLYRSTRNDYISAKGTLSKKSTHTTFCLHQSLSSCPVRPHYHITDCQFLSISAIVHSYLFQLQLVQSLEAKSILQDWFQVDMQRKAAGQWAYFPSSSFCYDFRCEICWWGGGWTDFLNWFVHWYENLLF